MKYTKVTYTAKHNKEITEEIETKNFKSIFSALEKKQEKGLIRGLKII